MAKKNLETYSAEMLMENLYRYYVAVPPQATTPRSPICTTGSPGPLAAAYAFRMPTFTVLSLSPVVAAAHAAAGPLPTSTTSTTACLPGAVLTPTGATVTPTIAHAPASLAPPVVSPSQLVQQQQQQLLLEMAAARAAQAAASATTTGVTSTPISPNSGKVVAATCTSPPIPTAIVNVAPRPATMAVIPNPAATVTAAAATTDAIAAGGISFAQLELAKTAAARSSTAKVTAGGENTPTVVGAMVQQKQRAASAAAATYSYLQMLPPGAAASAMAAARCCYGPAATATTKGQPLQQLNGVFSAAKGTVCHAGGLGGTMFTPLPIAALQMIQHPPPPPPPLISTRY